MVILQCAANAPMETTPVVTQEMCSVPAAFSSNDMDFYMGSDPYEGPTSCAWHGSNNNINAFPKAKTPIPPKPILLIKVTNETKAHAKNAKSEIAATMRNPGDDPRDAWLYISSCLAERELFSTGGVSVDPKGENTEPSQSEKEMLEVFVEANLDKWSINSGDLKFILSDARCMLYQAKDMVLRIELAALNTKKTKSVKVKVSRPAIYRKIDTAVSGMSREISSLDLNTICNNLVKHPDFDDNAQAYLSEQITVNTYMGKIAARSAVNESINSMKVKNRPETKTGRPQIDLEDHRSNSDRAYNIMTNQGANPRIFHNGGRMTEVLENESGDIRISVIDKPRFKGAYLEERIDFYVPNEKKGPKNVPATDALTNRVYQMPLPGYLPLFRITSFPTYSKELALVMAPGYHAGSGLYHKPKQGVTIPPVPEVPTKAEVKVARDDLVDLFADFPLDSMSRSELVAAVDKGDPVPSLCHILSVSLTPVMRDYIEGPTPLHHGLKDKPRTGATLLMGAASCVGTLEPATPQSLPEGRAEIQKTLISIIDSGEPFAFFDNLPAGETTESDELAAAVTAYPNYTGRRLGETAMVKARVKQVWESTGNRTQLSEQLRERTLLIELDPKMERPGERPTTSFKYSPLIPHIENNAGRYMHALLVLVQNWKADGCTKWKGNPLGGFEAHAEVIGGILDAAGIYGFMGNRDKLRDRMAVSEDPETELLDTMIEAVHSTPMAFKGTLFRVWSTEEPPKTIKDADKNDMEFKYAGCRVVAIRDLLVREQIAPPKWGYDYEDGDVIYPSKAKAKVTYHFGAMEGTVREWRDAQTEKEMQQGRYVLIKVRKDKHGMLYRLEQLPLIGIDE